MLKRMYIRKIYISCLAMFALLLIYLIPENTPILKVKEEIEYVDSKGMEADVFLMDKESFIALTEVPVNEKDIEKRARELIKILTIGGMDSKVPSGFSGIIPPDTEVLNISFDNNVLKIDFSKEILDVKQELEEKMIEAIVYTMTSIEKVDKIIIYVEGDILTKLPKTKINLPSTLDRSFGINKVFNLTSTKNITDVTIYYINQINENYYYVPVTKYLNDDKDKISIMIEELSNNNLNLKSYITDNTELVSSLIDDETVQINTNNKIENIQKEIDKMVSLTACDNLDVENILLNGKKINCK